MATICKTRVLSKGQQQLLRLDRDGDRAAFAAAAEGLLGEVLPLIDEQAAVVLADYEKGAITPAVARAVIDACRRRGIPCVVDPKKVDFTAYARRHGRDPEPAGGRAGRRPAAAGDEAVARAAAEMRAAFELDAMLITRGPDGMTLSTPGGISHIPAAGPRRGRRHRRRRHGRRRAGRLPRLGPATWPSRAGWPTSPPASPSATPGATSSRPTSWPRAWKGLSHKVLTARPPAAGSPRPAARPQGRLHQRLLRHPPRRPPRLPGGGPAAGRPPGRRPQFRRLGPRPQGGPGP